MYVYGRRRTVISPGHDFSNGCGGILNLPLPLLEPGRLPEETAGKGCNAAYQPADDSGDQYERETVVAQFQDRGDLCESR